MEVYIENKTDLTFDVPDLPVVGLTKLQPQPPPSPRELICTYHVNYLYSFDADIFMFCVYSCRYTIMLYVISRYDMVICVPADDTLFMDVIIVTYELEMEVKRKKHFRCYVLMPVHLVNHGSYNKPIRKRKNIIWPDN